MLSPAMVASSLRVSPERCRKAAIDAGRRTGDGLGSGITHSDTARNARPGHRRAIRRRAFSVADDVFEERAVDGGSRRPRVPHRREGGENDGEDAAIGFAVPFQQERLGGLDELVLLLRREGGPLLPTDWWQCSNDLAGAIPGILRLLRLRGLRRSASGQQQQESNDDGRSYGRFTRTRCP